MIVLLTRHSNNQPVSLTKQIADSGEGQVWETNLDGYLAKIYHDPTPARMAKLKVMLANPPADPMLSHNHVSIAWVSDLLKDSNGKYLGFLMPAIANSRQLSSVYNPRRRKKVAPGFNWYYLHVTALNTAWIIQSIHAKGYVLGDIKLENILVNDRAMTAVIDTDSFQVRDPQSNKVYRCTVGSEGFTPPELLGKDFDTTNQTEIHDCFRLGVLIHYLLFGYHPFSGNWTGVGESPEQTELIKQGYWYGGHNSPIRSSQTTIPLDVVHPELKKLFLRCFNDGHTQPHLRPTAQDWHNALEVAVNQLTSCSRIDSHYYSNHYGSCYWCDRAANLGVDIFPDNVTTTKVSSELRQDSSLSKISSKSYQKNIISTHNVQKANYQLSNSKSSNIQQSQENLEELFFHLLSGTIASFIFGIIAAILGTLIGLIINLFAGNILENIVLSSSLSFIFCYQLCSSELNCSIITNIFCFPKGIYRVLCLAIFLISDLAPIWIWLLIIKLLSLKLQFTSSGIIIYKAVLIQVVLAIIHKFNSKKL